MGGGDTNETIKHIATPTSGGAMCMGGELRMKQSNLYLAQRVEELHAWTKHSYLRKRG